MGKILSIYIENEGMRICEVDKSGKAVVVRNAFEVSLPSGLVEDGMIMDVEETAKALYTALKNNKIKRGKIAFVISSKRIGNKEIVIPFVKNPKKIEEIIAANVSEYFPMNNLEDYIFRHTVLDTSENEEGKHLSILVMAFQKQMVEGYYQLAGMLKMPVITVDYYGNAMYQLLRKQLNQGTVLAIQMDHNTSNVSIMQGKTQLFKRSIPYGRETVIRNLAELKSITEEEAEDILSDSRKVDMMLTPDEYGEVIRDFSSSVTRMAEFHTSRNPGIAIELAKLMGSGIGLVGFPEALGRELGIEVTLMKELVGLKIARKNPAGLDYETIVDYLPCIGALLQPLDLKVEEEKKKTSSYALFYVLIVISALVIAGTSGFLLYAYSGQKEIKRNLEKQISEMAGSEAIYLDYLANKSDYDLVKNYYDSTVNSSEALYSFILDLEEVMPRSVGITTFTINNGVFTMTGISGGKEPIADFIIELKKIPYVSNVRVQNITDTYDEFGQVESTFNMTFNIAVIEPEEVQETEEAAEGGAQ